MKRPIWITEEELKNLEEVDRMFYGEKKSFTAQADYEEGEPFLKDGKIAVACQKVKKGRRGKMYDEGGSFIFRCHRGLAFDVGDMVAWNPKTKAICYPDEKGAITLGENQMRCPLGNRLVMVYIRVKAKSGGEVK